MTDKIITLATEEDALQLRRAIFERWKADELKRRGDTVLDRDRLGRALVPQVTTEYVGTPPPVLPANWTPGDPMPVSDKKTVVVNATVEAMQGAKVTVDGKPVTIDVSTAVAVAQQDSRLAAAAPTKRRRAAIVGGSAAGAGAATAGALAAAGLSPTFIAAGGVLGAVVAGALAVFGTKTHSSA
jgi:hypothetical protein